MRRFWVYAAVLLVWLPLSCTRSPSGETIAIHDTSGGGAETAARLPETRLPAVIMRAGTIPLWFQFTDAGPALLESIEDAYLATALTPWPLAAHVRFMLAQDSHIVMAVNRDGFTCLVPWEDHRVALYHFSGGELWRRSTVGALASINARATALLYRDDRFLDPDSPLPAPRWWTFDWNDGLSSLSLPAPDIFAPQDGWDIDALRQSGDGWWYFRATKKEGGQPELRMLRARDLTGEGEPVSLGAFQGAAAPQPLSAAPQPLGAMLAAVFAASGAGAATVISPAFDSACSFAADREKAALTGFYGAPSGQSDSGAFLLAILPHGRAFYGKNGAVAAFSLPSLPAGFVYTGIGVYGNTLIAAWEDQDEYSIGAAGFMVCSFYAPL